ncbi:CLAVATA3/ESR (CLE)-related protein [Salix suchowensis]|uniref:CLAVATA3/ESR (CLE)-RELATED PROTEIN 16 n=1 Tax=Salix koriyanagi TaxID=2511006 RepID=A0A9Q0WRD7_9ROSI|nr:CLAVATA3/ESR (CLE)-related protein [Salix suchowensis]KAJ6771859.1 CLAVATA3/ESR (CLE)-RELATED PROTEIN 16 [Salix koriyanagi]
MISHYKVGVEAARDRRYAGARAAIIFLFWILFILAQLGFFLAVHEETDKLVKSLPRKARFFETESFHASPNMDQPVNNIDGGDSDSLYEDDKRIVYTGPNPLHN